MRRDFLELAQSIKSKFEARFSKEKLQTDYIYNKLDGLMQEWKTGEFSGEKTDIGVAGVYQFDSMSKEDVDLANDISELAFLYRRKKFIHPKLKK